MSPKILRLIAFFWLALMLALAAIWLLQELGVIDWLDDPLAGIIGFGLIGLLLKGFADRKSGETPKN